MSILSDVQVLYSSVRGIWTKSRVDIIAHAVLAVVVFGICGATIPRMAVWDIDPKQISNSEWFKLAKDTGIIYVAFVIPIVIVTVYAALLRTGGALLVFIVTLIVPPSQRSRSQYRLLTPSALEPLALTLQKSDFDLNDLLAKSSELALKYQSQKNGQMMEGFQKSISNLTKNSQLYLADFLFFLFCWIAVFRFLPNAPWIQTNEARYWPVVLLLSVLAWFAWFRVSRALAFVPSMLLMYLIALIRTDPDMKAVLEVSEEKRESIRQRLDELLRKEQEHATAQPSLLGFIKYKLGLVRKAAGSDEVNQHRSLPFPLLYERGSRFASDKASPAYDDRQWLAGYFAYLYYRLHRRLSRLAKSIWQLVRLIVTGAP